MKNKFFNLKIGKKYRIKIGQYPEYAEWKFGEILSKTEHSKYTTSYFFNESVMNKKYPKKEYFGGYIWTESHGVSSSRIIQAEELILFDTVSYLNSVAPIKKPVCEKLTT